MQIPLAGIFHNVFVGIVGRCEVTKKKISSQRKCQNLPLCMRPRIYRCSRSIPTRTKLRRFFAAKIQIKQSREFLKSETAYQFLPFGPFVWQFDYQPNTRYRKAADYYEMRN